MGYRVLAGILPHARAAQIPTIKTFAFLPEICYTMSTQGAHLTIMLPSAQHKACCDFYDAMRDQFCLDRRTLAIVGLTAAISRECRP